jgi:adenylosuccinate lyase
MARDDAYRAVQRNAVATSEQQRTFAEVLADDPEVAAALSSERLAAAFSLDTALEHASRSVDRL